MKRLLVLTPLDVAGSANSRTHHLVRHLASRFQETVAVSKANITHRPRRERWSNLVRWRAEERQEGPIRWISVSPCGNIRHGLGLSLLGLTNPYVAPPLGFRRILRRAFSFLGVVLEFGILPSFLAVFFLRVGGRFEVIVAEGPWEAVLGILLRKFHRAQVVIYDDIDYAPGFQPISKLRQRLIARIERFGIRRADCVITVSHRLKQLRETQGARTVRFVPNGVDVSRFDQACFARRQKVEGWPALFYSGYLGAWAGTDLLVEAMALARRRIPNLRLIVVGHGAPEDLASLRARCDEMGLDGAFEYRGEVPYGDLPLHMSEAEIGMAMFRPLDLTRYAFPLKVVEYMAAGLPVITTEDTEAGEIVGEARAGLAVSFSPSAVADAVAKILGDREFRRRCSENGRLFSRAYDWRSLMDQAYDAVESTIENKRSVVTAKAPAEN